MWWEKKTRPAAEPPIIVPEEAPPAPPEVETSMSEPTPKVTNPTPKSTNPPAAGSPHTILGRTVVVQGQVSSGEDLMIEGQFEGTIHLDDHCLTVGTEGHVKAEIRARQVVILGSVTGNLAAREKIEIRRTGHVVGDLVAATVAIEEGAYFKGSIDIARDNGTEAAPDVAAPGTLKTNA
jgi:cytoskeletal protein CcmA (bactofilin family)